MKAIRLPAEAEVRIEGRIPHPVAVCHFPADYEVKEFADYVNAHPLAIIAEQEAGSVQGEAGHSNALDAARYRWLREQHWSDSTLAVVCDPKKAVRLGEDCPSLDRLDAAIDAALAKQAPKPEPAVYTDKRGVPCISFAAQPASLTRKERIDLELRNLQEANNRYLAALASAP